MDSSPLDDGVGPRLDAKLDAMTPAELDDYIAAHIQIIANLEHQLLSAYATLERRDLHLTDGCNVLATWIQTRTYCEHHTATETARVAAALTPLTHIRARYAAGELDYDQVRQLTRFVTVDTDAEWADRAADKTARQLGREAKRHRPPRLDNRGDEAAEGAETSDTPEPVEPEAAQRRSLSFRYLPDGSVEYRIHLPGLDGAITLASLERQAERYGPDAATGTWAPRSERLADAFCDLVGAARPSKSAERCTVVVHVPQPDDTRDGGYGAYVDHPYTGPISDEDVELLGCHSRMQVSLDDLDGHPVGIGKLSKQWPPWLFQAIWHRDGACRWPGCSNTIGLAVHHEQPWSHPKGRTDYDAGFLLCSRHHRFRHKEKWRIEGDPRATLTFIRPDGTTFEPRPGPLPPDIQARLDNLGDK